MASLANINNVALQSVLGTACLTKAVLAITSGGSCATYETGAAVNYIIDGRYYVQSAVITAGTFSTGHTALASGEKCFFALCIDAAGNVTTVQGPIFKAATVNGVSCYVDKYFNTAAVQSDTNPYPSSGRVFTVTGEFLPEVSSSVVPFGLIKIEGVFTPNTTNLDDAGITATYYDLMVLPSAESNL